MKRRYLTILALLLTVTLGAVAQTAPDGRKVKRITFDQEQVCFEYVDGTADEGVSNTTVVYLDQTTDVKTLKPQASNLKPQTSNHLWYTLDGRALQSEPQEKGVYIMIDEKGIKRTIRK